MTQAIRESGTVIRSLPTDASERPARVPALRIVHVVQHLKSGGAETLVRGLCAGLARAAFDVTVVSVYPDALSAAERDALGFTSLSAARDGRADLGFAPRLVGQIRAARPDVVHAHLHAGKYAGRIAALVARAPHIVFTEHGDEAGGTLRFAVNRVLHARTERFVTFNDEQRRAFAKAERVPLERVVVIPNGVARPPAIDRAAVRATLGLDAAALAYYMPARMTEQKNHALALRAFARAWPGDPTRVLVLAGSGPLEASLRALADELGIAARTRFLGFRDDAAALARAVDAFVMTSVWERMPLALGEAMLAGLPVVTTPWTGHADVVRDGETGFVARANDDDAVVAALRRTDDDVARARVAANARAFAESTFDLDESVRRHAALYTSLVAGVAR